MHPEGTAVPATADQAVSEILYYTATNYPPVSFGATRRDATRIGIPIMTETRNAQVFLEPRDAIGMAGESRRSTNRFIK